MRRSGLIFLGVAAVAASLHADDFGRSIARKYATRAGDRLAALQSIYAEGRTLINDEIVPFKMWAQRPNRLRFESITGSRRVIQVYDGQHEPWISHSEVAAGAPQAMSAGEKKDFVENADFDGPLVDFEAKGHTVDFAGESAVDGRRADKLLLMNTGGDVFFLWVDAGTHEVVKRSVIRTMNGQRVPVETFFGDFRNVGGVLQPHRIETRMGGTVLYLMIISKMVANPPDLPTDIFSPPAGWPLEKKPGDAKR
jgi:outer membrane lipoprotein-sorting protein